MMEIIKQALALTTSTYIKNRILKKLYIFIYIYKMLVQSMLVNSGVTEIQLHVKL